MRLIRIMRGRPRQLIAVLCGLATWLVWPRSLEAHTRGLLSWDVGCVVFLGLATQLFSTERDMPRDAAMQEEGEWTVFAIVVAGMAASLIAIISEFSSSHGADGKIRGLLIGLVIATLMLSWLATHTIFALRYAHEYYSDAGDETGVQRGLDFPGGAAPDYWDFFYFALVLGMTFQVSDVEITSRKLRRLATIHGLLSFIFSTVILALTVNLGASLLTPS